MELEEFERIESLNRLIDDSLLALLECNVALRLMQDVMPLAGRAMGRAPDADVAVALASLRELTANRARIEDELLVSLNNLSTFSARRLELLAEQEP